MWLREASSSYLLSPGVHLPLCPVLSYLTASASPLQSVSSWFLVSLRPFPTFSFLQNQKRNKQRRSTEARSQILRGEKNNSILIKLHLSIQKVNCWWISPCLINHVCVCARVCVAFRLPFSYSRTWKEQIIISINQPFKSICVLRLTQIQMLGQWFNLEFWMMAIASEIII